MCLRSLKGKLIFIIGFLVGFILTILFVSIDDNYKLSINTQNTFPKAWKLYLSNEISEDYENPSYKNFLQNQNVIVKSIDMDKKQYGPNDIEDESHWLKTKIHITCVVTVEKIKLAKTINDTWASRCNKILYFSRNYENKKIPVIKIKKRISSSWQMLCEIMHYIWRDADKLEWIIFVKDDTIVIPENLRHLVAHLDYNKSYYLGHPVMLWGQAYNVAQAGYVLSKGTLSKLMKTFDTNDKCLVGGKYWKKEDYDLGKNLKNLNIHPIDMRDDKKRGTFHGYSLQTLLFGVAKPGSYFTKALYPIGDDCCSSKSVTFNVAETNKVYTFNYILYYLNVYRQFGRYGSLLASTPVPEDEVLFLIYNFAFNKALIVDGNIIFIVVI